MPTYLFQTIFAGSSGLPADQYVNTWHFANPGSPGVTDFDNVRDMLKDFYCTAPTGNAIRTYLGGQMSTTVKVKGYNLDHEKPRAPVYEGTFTSAGWAGAAVLPGEVALCFSFEAAKQSGEKQARRRNRVYLGPLATSTLGSPGLVAPNVCTDVVNAGKRLGDAAAASVTWDWKVYSQLDNEIHDVKHIWCDNSFDTQRRRGLQPTARTEHTF